MGGSRNAAATLAIFLVGVTAAVGQGYRVEPAPDWNAVFDRETGWTGADGIYSIPLDGREVHGGYANTSTMFLFSDTFVGANTEAGRRSLWTTLVNNTLGYRAPAEDLPGSVMLRVARDTSDQPIAFFDPALPEMPLDHWYWLKDGIAIEGSVYLFAARFRTDPVDWFAREGLSLIVLPEGPRTPVGGHLEFEVPLALPAESGRNPVVFGAGIMANTQAAGAPDPDGYIYIYGTQEDPQKKALVARVPEDGFLDPAEWRFWNGSGWTEDIRASASIASRVSNELSVTPLSDGRYLMVFQLDQVGPQVAVRIGQTPWGPFGTYEVIYTCPEQNAFTQVYCYNAKAHPHLSQPGELLISYNVNTLIFENHWKNPDIYRPRFIRLVLEP